jgi:hypothetical protein
MNEACRCQVSIMYLELRFAPFFLNVELHDNHSILLFSKLDYANLKIDIDEDDSINRI